MKRKLNNIFELVKAKKRKLNKENEENYIDALIKELQNDYYVSQDEAIRVTEIINQLTSQIGGIQKVHYYAQEPINLRKSISFNINLSPRVINNIETVAISYILKKNLPLTILNLNNCKLSEEQIEILSDALKKNVFLFSLNLSKNKIGSEGGLVLAEALKYSRNLTTLIIKLNDLENEGTIAIANALKFKALKLNNTLTTLNLGKNKIGKEGAIALAEALNMTILSDLSLYDNRISNKGAKALADVLKENDCLTSLNLSSNRINNEGAKNLAESLKTNNTLTILKLNNNKFNEDGIKALGEAIRLNNSLINLEINCINSQKKIAKIVNTFKSIEKTIKRNKIKLEDLKEHALEIFKKYNCENDNKTSSEEYFEKVPLYVFKYLFSLNENIVAKFFNNMLSSFLKKEKKYFKANQGNKYSKEKLLSLAEKVNDKSGKWLVKSFKENYLQKLFFIKNSICKGEDIGALEILPFEILLSILEKSETYTTLCFIEENLAPVIGDIDLNEF